MAVQKIIKKVMAMLLLSAAPALYAGEQDAEALWQSTYEARQQYFEKTIGILPPDILKMLNMTGVWPGGGLYVIPATKIDSKLSVYTTFGFTNADMPATTQLVDFSLQADSTGNRAASAEGTLSAKQSVAQTAGHAGYGYEIFILTKSGEQWPLGLLQWLVNAEIGHDAGILDRVEKYDGLTVESVDIGEEKPVNILISKAEQPLPTGTKLPNGQMQLLVATTITEDEMRWSQQHGRKALLQKLKDAGVGQVSILERASVVKAEL